jgi:hypothetical protein
MARNKSGKLYPFEKLLTLLISGEAYTVQQIEEKLGDDIYIYRLSTYMWHIKTNANGVIRTVKDGRKVVSYQLVNVKEVKKYMDRVGASKSNFQPGQEQKKPSKAKVKTKVVKLVDLDAKPIEVPEVPEVVESASEVMEIMEISK